MAFKNKILDMQLNVMLKQSYRWFRFDRSEVNESVNVIVLTCGFKAFLKKAKHFLIVSFLRERGNKLLN